MDDVSILISRLSGRHRSVYAVLFIVALVSLLLIPVLSANRAWAAAAPAAITVAPAYVTAQIGALQPEVTVAVGVRNNSDTAITMSAELSGLDVQDNNLRLTDTPDRNLATTTTVTPSSYTIAAADSINILVNIKNSPNLAPGGHYLSLLLTQTSTSNSSQQLALRPAISATIFVIKEDGALRQINATRLNTNGNFWRWPNRATTTFTNTGNVYLVPRGVVQVAPGQAVLSQGIINTASIPLYPKQSITLQTNLVDQAKPWWPGRHSLALQYRYDGQDEIKTLRRTFWYIPTPWFGIFGVLLIGLVGLSRPKYRQRLRQIAERTSQSSKPPATQNSTMIAAPMGQPKGSQVIEITGQNDPETSPQTITVRRQPTKNSKPST